MFPHPSMQPSIEDYLFAQSYMCTAGKQYISQPCSEEYDANVLKAYETLDRDTRKPALQGGVAPPGGGLHEPVDRPAQHLPCLAAGGDELPALVHVRDGSSQHVLELSSLRTRSCPTGARSCSARIRSPKWTFDSSCLQRLLSLILVLIGGSIAIFAILRFLPGDPVVVMLGFEYNPEVVEEMRRELGFDKPPPIQYLDWITGVLQGDLGRSYFLRREVYGSSARAISHHPDARLREPAGRARDRPPGRG